MRYVLEGSVERNSNRVRVNAQLIDAETGAHLWADRFDDDMADLFKLQDDIVARLANALRVELVDAAAENAARSKNPEAIDFVMRGVKLTEAPFARDKLVEARKWFDKALEVDPLNSDAIAYAASTYVNEYWFGWKNPDVDYDAKVIAETDRAIALDRGNVAAYVAKGSYLIATLRLNDALRVVDTGLDIDPIIPSFSRCARSPKTIRGDFEQAKADILRVMRLSPHDPSLSFWHNLMADAELGLGRPTPRSRTRTRLSTADTERSSLISISPPPTRSRAKLKRRSLPWPRLEGKTRRCRSSGSMNISRSCNPLSTLCATPDFRKNDKAQRQPKN